MISIKRIVAVMVQPYYAISTKQNIMEGSLPFISPKIICSCFLSKSILKSSLQDMYEITNYFSYNKELLQVIPNDQIKSSLFLLSHITSCKKTGSATMPFALLPSLEQKQVSGSMKNRGWRCQVKLVEWNQIDGTAISNPL